MEKQEDLRAEGMTQVPTQSKPSPSPLRPSSCSGRSVLDELPARPFFSLVYQDGDSPGKEEPVTPVPVKTQLLPACS